MAQDGCRYPRFGACVLVCLILSTAVFAAAKADRTQFGNNINIGPNEEVADVTCVGCSIRVRGQVSGDATAVAGSVLLADQAQVAGDVTAVAGDIELDNQVKVGGDVTVVGGKLRRGPQASVSGDVTTVGGRGWIVPILLTPFVFLGLLIAFVIWLIQRLRGSSAPAMPA
ncbi:MAG: hypothetical protein WAM69_09420 [Candidatus Sulfotelmatobacter sp.]